MRWKHISGEGGHVIRIEVSETVHHPREAVFAAAADTEEQLRWDRETLKSVEKLTPGQIGQGARYRGRFKGFGIVEFEFAEFEAPRRLAVLARIKPGEMRHTFTFETAGDGTRVSQVGELTPNLLGRLMAPMIRRMLAKRFHVIASELEAHLAGSGAAGL
jgi:uncharacterized protein YndB with AHSA1/START domain